MKYIRAIICICLVMMMLSSCSTWRKLNPTEQGAIIGSGTGAAIGAIATDSAGGALVGGGIGAVGGGLLGHFIYEDERRNRR